MSRAGQRRLDDAYWLGVWARSGRQPMPGFGASGPSANHRRHELGQCSRRVSPCGSDRLAPPRVEKASADPVVARHRRYAPPGSIVSAPICGFSSELQSRRRPVPDRTSPATTARPQGRPILSQRASLPGPHHCPFARQKLLFRQAEATAGLLLRLFRL
jgi:hypothetical protein